MSQAEILAEILRQPEHKKPLEELLIAARMYVHNHRRYEQLRPHLFEIATLAIQATAQIDGATVDAEPMSQAEMLAEILRRPEHVRLRAPLKGGPVDVPRQLAEQLYELGEDLGADELLAQLREALKIPRR